VSTSAVLSCCKTAKLLHITFTAAATVMLIIRTVSLDQEPQSQACPPRRIHIILFFHGATAQLGPRPPRCWCFYITHNQTHTTFSRTPLWTCDQLVTEAATYITHNKHKRRTSMHTAGFEPAIPEIERPQNYASDRQPPGSARIHIQGEKQRDMN
jgi:hypothetical protein